VLLVHQVESFPQGDGKKDEVTVFWALASYSSGVRVRVKELFLILRSRVSLLKRRVQH